MVIWAICHLEYPISLIAITVATVGIATGNGFANCDGTKTANRWRITGPRSRILFVALQPPSVTQAGQVMDTLTLYLNQVQMDSAAIGQLTIAHVSNALQGITPGIMNRLIAYWSGQGGVAEDLRWVKGMLANCVYEWRWLPLRDDTAGVTYFRTFSGEINAGVGYNNWTPADLVQNHDVDRFCSLGMQAVPIAETRADMPVLQYSLLSHIMRGLLALGLIQRTDSGLGPYTEGQWLWGDSDWSDLRPIAESYMHGADAVAQSKNIIMSQVYSGSPTSLQMVAWQRVTHSYVNQMLGITTGQTLVIAVSHMAGISRQAGRPGMPGSCIGINRIPLGNLRYTDYNFEELTVNNNHFSTRSKKDLCNDMVKTRFRSGLPVGEFYVKFNESSLRPPNLFLYMAYMSTANQALTLGYQFYDEAGPAGNWIYPLTSNVDGWIAYITTAGATRANYANYRFVGRSAWWSVTQTFVDGGPARGGLAYIPAFKVLALGNDVMNGIAPQVADVTGDSEQIDSITSDTDGVELFKNMMAPLKLDNPFGGASQEQSGNN